MAQKTSRRTMLKATVVTAAGAALPTAAMAKETTIKDLNKALAKPLTPANEKLTEVALKAVFDASAQRLKHRLPENSEPSLAFSVRPAEAKKW